MKLKKLFPFLIVILAFMTSCTDETTITLLDEIQVSSSYVSIPMAGGADTITVMAKDSFKVKEKEKVVVVNGIKDTVLVPDIPEWLTISAVSGAAGESTLVFTAASTINGRSAEVLIKCGDITQRINVIQGLSKVVSATCAEVMAGVDGKNYQVTGVCTSIANTQYGNWYLKDATGSVYVYGTLDAKGQTKNFSSLGLEVGDEVTVQGPRLLYGTTVELVNVTVLKITKSLVKVDSVKNAIVAGEGGEFTAYLTCKGQGVSVSIPDDAKSWLSISSIQSVGQKTTMKFSTITNPAGSRSTTLTFSTTDGTKTYTTQTALTQRSVIKNVTVAEFIAAPISTYSYRLSGVISSITDAATGKVNLKDDSGEVYVYKISNLGSKVLKVGDAITVVGLRGAFGGVAQVDGSFMEN